MDPTKYQNTENLEYVFLTKSSELWEINYTEGYAKNISEINRQKISDLNTTEYNASIEEFLTNERGFRNIHFHDSITFKGCIIYLNKF